MGIFHNKPTDPNKRFLLRIDLGHYGSEKKDPFIIEPDYEGYTDAEVAEFKEKLLNDPLFKDALTEFSRIRTVDVELSQPRYFSRYGHLYPCLVIPTTVTAASRKTPDASMTYQYTIDIVPLNITLGFETGRTYHNVDNFVRKLHDIALDIHFKENGDTPKCPSLNEHMGQAVNA